MAYSKFLRQSNCLINRSIKTVRLSNLLKSQSKISWGASLNNCYYSTIFNSKFSETWKPIKSASPLTLSAFLSTDGSSETYKIVITNPSEGTSTTLDSSLNTPNEIINAEEISQAPSSIDIATPLTDNVSVDIATPLTDNLSSAAEVLEPTLASLGLCSSYTPVGWIQMGLEWMHVGMHWPWWVCIVVTTCVARVLLFPLLLKTQKNAIDMANNMPQLQYLQVKFGEARRTGNSVEAAKYAHEMMNFMKEKNISPLKNTMWPLLQAPVFLSFFFALRAMAKVPVESMKYGGVLWATDLTIPDPYYIMPVIACGTLYIVLKIGAESGIKLENLKMAKYFVQFLPVLALPFCINFPAAVLYYWVTNNFCTLAVVSFLKIQPVRQYFNLPTQQQIDPKFVLPKKGFVQGMKDSFEDQKVLANVEERRRMDEIRFQKAGTGPIPRTYSYDPTKPRPSTVASIASKAMAAKERKV